MLNKFGICESAMRRPEHISFKLTRKGLDWLGNALNIKIYDKTMLK